MTYEPRHQPPYTQQPPQGPVTYDEPPRNPSTDVPPGPRAKLQGVWLYLAILATVYVVASLVLGVVSYRRCRATPGRCRGTPGRSSSYGPRLSFTRRFTASAQAVFVPPASVITKFDATRSTPLPNKPQGY